MPFCVNFSHCAPLCNAINTNNTSEETWLPFLRRNGRFPTRGILHSVEFPLAPLERPPTSEFLGNIDSAGDFPLNCTAGMHGSRYLLGCRVPEVIQLEDGCLSGRLVLSTANEREKRNFRLLDSEIFVTMSWRWKMRHNLFPSCCNALMVRWRQFREARNDESQSTDFGFNKTNTYSP